MCNDLYKVYILIWFNFDYYLGVIYVYFIKLFVFGCVSGIWLLYLIFFKEVMVVFDLIIWL